MPVLELRENGLDSARILAVMNFPHDETMRRSFYALQFAKGQLESKERGASIEIQAALLDDLIDAPSYAEMRVKTSSATRRGIVAGDFLATIFGMYSFPDHFAEPSVRKAIVVAQAFARKTKFGDGSKLPTSTTAIRGCFDEYRPVAHLWAAFRLHQAFPIREHRELLGSPEAVRDFLGIAGKLQDFGCSFIPKRAKPATPLLDLKSVWDVPSVITRLNPPWSKPPAWLVSTVGSYKASRHS